MRFWPGPPTGAISDICEIHRAGCFNFVEQVLKKIDHLPAGDHNGTTLAKAPGDLVNLAHAQL